MTDEELVMRPFVQLAAICQAVIQDVQGSMSAIRILDRIQVTGPNDAMQPQPLHNLWIVVILKAGPMRGSFRWSITPVTPSKQRLPALEMAALFEGDERGIAFTSPLMITAEEDGLFWFEVRVEGQLLTQIPLRVLYQKQPPMQQPPFQAPSGD